MEDVKLRERIFGATCSEWEDTVKMLFAVTGSTTLLQDNPSFARSLLTRTIYLTINGIAIGLRNNG